MKKYFPLFAALAIFVFMVTPALADTYTFDFELGQTNDLPGKGSNERNEEAWLESLLGLPYGSDDVMLVTKFDDESDVESFLENGYSSWDYAILKQAGTWTTYWDSNSNDRLDIALQDIGHITLFRADDGAPPSSVPVPGAVWLLGSGLVGLIGFKRKFSA